MTGGIGYLLSMLLYPGCVCWSWTNPICSEMWSATGLFTGTSFIYFVYKPSQYRHLSVRSFVPFLCRWFPASQIRCSFRLSSSCLLFKKIVLKILLNGWVTASWRQMMINWAYGHWHQVKDKSGHPLPCPYVHLWHQLICICILRVKSIILMELVRSVVMLKSEPCSSSFCCKNLPTGVSCCQIQSSFLMLYLVFVYGAGFVNRQVKFSFS